MLAGHCLCSGVGSNSVSVGGCLGGARTSLRNTVFNERLVITTAPRALLQSGSGGYWISVTAQRAIARPRSAPPAGARPISRKRHQSGTLQPAAVA